MSPWWWWNKARQNKASEARCRTLLAEVNRRQSSASTVDEETAFASWLETQLESLSPRERMYVEAVMKGQQEFTLMWARIRLKQAAEVDPEQVQDLRDAELLHRLEGYRRAAKPGEDLFALLPSDLQERLLEWSERRAGRQALERLIQDAGGKPYGGPDAPNPAP